jgi:hypothetical protein
VYDVCYDSVIYLLFVCLDGIIKTNKKDILVILPSVTLAKRYFVECMSIALGKEGTPGNR